MSSMRYFVLEARKRVRYCVGYVKAPLAMALATGSPHFGTLVVGRTPHFENRGRMSVGAAVRFRSTVRRSQISTGRGGHLIFGNCVSVNQGVTIDAQQLVEIGDRVQIGDEVRIHDSNFHVVKPGGSIRTAPVRVGSDVWLGARVTILPGVTIGRGSVVGSGAIVSKSIPEGTLVLPAAPSAVARYSVPDSFRRRGR